MTLSITHTTPADGTFSTTGAAAWDATHSLGGVADISQGGTNATTAAGARTALGLGTIATQDANAVAVTGGTINGTTVGSTTAAAGAFTTLNSSGNTRLGGLSGNQSLQVNNVASAVNYAQIVGAVTGGAPTLSIQGTDTNIGLVLSGKGTGVVALGGTTAANSGLQVKPTVSGVNYIQINGNTAGNGVNLQAEGSDADVALSIRAKGTFNIPFFTGGGTQFLISHTGSAVNYVRATGAATTAAPELAAIGSDTNINLKLTPKGTGVVQFGTYTAGIIAQAGYITITDAAGTSRRLLVG